MTTEKFMNKRIDTHFESSSGKTKQFVDFARECKETLKAIAKGIGAELIHSKPGHFYLCGFFKRDDKYVYFSIKDVRQFGERAKNVLYRTAKSEKDWSGGSNHYTTFERLSQDIDLFFQN